ncbi:MAG: thiamine phosphate synthase [Nitrospiraceae bacterium]|nr:thiamine phosphate synthase [Nitrospiraceae bacterium]
MRPDFRIYLITDSGLVPDLAQAVDRALSGAGAKAPLMAVQFREKSMPARKLLETAKRLREVTARHGARLFVNDRVDVAMLSGADGVHLGVNSMPADAARRVCGDNMMIGVSTHSMEEARSARALGADFITFGPVFATPSKLRYGNPVGTELLSDVAKGIDIPVFAIGGIDGANINEVMRRGAEGIALIRAVFGARDIEAGVKTIMERF